MWSMTLLASIDLALSAIAGFFAIVYREMPRRRRTRTDYTGVEEGKKDPMNVGLVLSDMSGRKL